MMNNDWKKQIKEALEKKGMSMKAASLAAGKGETYVRDILERGRMPTIDNFVALAEILDLSIVNLLGNISTVEDEVAEIARIYPNLSEKHKQVVLATARGLVAEPDKSK